MAGGARSRLGAPGHHTQGSAIFPSGLRGRAEALTPTGRAGHVLFLLLTLGCLMPTGSPAEANPCSRPRGVRWQTLFLPHLPTRPPAHLLTPRA